MVKAPVAGGVKRRLAHDIGVVEATRFARHTAAAVLQRVARDRRWQTVLAVTPDPAIEGRWCRNGVPRVAQGGGGLGQRMKRLFRSMMPGPVVIVGSDIPGITPVPVARAFRELGRHDAVFGPAEDGGYWLVGLNWRLRAAGCFERVRWSTCHALADTVANLADRSIGYVARLGDVDDGAAFAKHGARAGRRIPDPAPAPRLAQRR